VTARPLTTDDLPALAVALADELERRGAAVRRRPANSAPETLTEERRRAAILKGRRNAKRLGVRSGAGG